MNENSHRWLSVKEAASRLGVHEITLYRLIARGQAPAAKLGRKVLIDWQKLEAELEAQINRRAK
jgi:excisionase family DNA binding protein